MEPDHSHVRPDFIQCACLNLQSNDNRFSQRLKEKGEGGKEEKKKREKNTSGLNGLKNWNGISGWWKTRMMESRSVRKINSILGCFWPSLQLWGIDHFWAALISAEETDKWIARGRRKGAKGVRSLLGSLFLSVFWPRNSTSCECFTRHEGLLILLVIAVFSDILLIDFFCWSVKGILSA